jgi:RNA polymerase sigma-70 factor (ECF subfamily)
VALRQEEFTSLCDDVDLDRDRVLVERCQAGDSAAFGNLYARYYERLLRFCLRRLNDRHEAEDAAQEAFARAWKALPKFAGERRFYPWLTVIAGNICTDVLRRRSRSTPTDDLELGAHQPVGGVGSETSEEVILAAVDGQLVNRALDRLSVRHRHVLAMREGSGWTYQQMADHEGVEIGTIETLLWRARQALKREFNVLSESKGALAGFLAGAGVLIRRGVLRVAHKVSLVPSTGSSGVVRNVLTGAAVTGAAVTAALVAPHAFSASPAPVPTPASVRSAASLASPPLPLTLANSAIPSRSSGGTTGLTGSGSHTLAAPSSSSSATPSGGSSGLTSPGTLAPGGAGVTNSSVGSTVRSTVGQVVAPVGQGLGQAAGALGGTTGGEASSGLQGFLEQLGLVPTTSNTPATPETTVTIPPVVNKATSTVTSLAQSVLGVKP